MAVNLRKREATDSFLATLELPQGGWVQAACNAARDRMAAMGLPHGRDEYWKFTRPEKLLAPAGKLENDGAVSAFAETERLKLVFVGGVFDASQSDDPSEAGIELLSAVSGLDIHWAQSLYGALETNGQNPVDRPLAALNTAVATEGVLIRVPGKAARPVELVYQPGPEGAAPVLHHVIKLEEGTELTVLETGALGAMANTVMEVEIADGASFHHIRTQGPALNRRIASHIFTRLGKESAFKSFTLAAGGELTRNECVIDLTGDDASAHVAAVAIEGAGVHHDDTIFITHGAEGCESRQVFKKVLKEGSTGVFQGKILVKPGAQKTDGYQISQSLLLDDGAEFLAKPELEIYADDVKCSHGSTSGAIDETALYYLRARGVPKAVAQHLLVLAFLAEVTEEIADETLREQVVARLSDWLEAA